MIKKLNKRIQYIIFIPITVLLSVGVCLYLITSFNNTIDITSRLYDRFRPDETIVESEYQVYSFIVENDTVLFSNNNYQSTTYSDIPLDEATLVSKLPISKGYVGTYVFTKTNNQRGTSITLIENTSIVSKLKTYVYTSLVFLVISIFVVWYLAKYLAGVIVKPVENTLESQKRFISDASHELKTPLAVIGANVEVLETKQGSSKWSQYIVQEVKSMNKLVNDLLVLSKMEDVNPNIQTQNLSQLVELYSSVFEPLAYESHLSFDTKIEKDIQYNCASEDIERIVGVLVDNAIKHSDDMVLVTLSKQKHDITLIVSNTGEEIPKEDQSKIFDRFYRVDKSRNREEKRYGLGLSIANSAASRNNASISVHCENHTTSFIVKFKA